MQRWQNSQTLLVLNCALAAGKKTTKEKKVIEITLDKGCPSDYRKVFYGEVGSRAFFALYCTQFTG